MAPVPEAADRPFSEQEFCGELNRVITAVTKVSIAPFKDKQTHKNKWKAQSNLPGLQLKSDKGHFTVDMQRSRIHRSHEVSLAISWMP